VRTLEPNSAFHAWSSVPFRSLEGDIRVHGEPFHLVNSGEWLASGLSWRCTLPAKECGPAALCFCMLRSAPARYACAAAGVRVRLAVLAGHETTCPACHAPDDSAESSETRVVVVGFNLRTFFQRYPSPRKDLTSRWLSYDRMLGAQRPPDAGQGDAIRSSVAPLPAERLSGATSQPLRRRDA